MLNDVIVKNNESKAIRKIEFFHTETFVFFKSQLQRKHQIMLLLVKLKLLF